MNDFKLQKLYVKDLLVLNFDKVKLNKPFSLFYTWIKIVLIYMYLTIEM